MASDAHESLDHDSLLKALRELETEHEDLKSLLGIVMDHNTALENELYSRNADLQLGMIEKNSELEASRDLNRKAHQHLMMTEKLAKLGELVAGMTHELNTPIGVAVTAASYQQTCTAHLVDGLSHNAGRILDDVLMASLRCELEAITESSAMVQSNLKRAAEIVGAFKQMAVDQVGDRPREVCLAETIRQTLISLRPRFRGTPFLVEMECSETLRIFSYPGTISQIITNLVTNSLVHGFDGRTDGTIRISARLVDELEPDVVILRHEDDGRGIAPEILSRIFEQFFTTREGEGGTGLGLYIVRSLVEERLGGSVSCSSQLALGDQPGWTAFDIRIPVDKKHEGM